VFFPGPGRQRLRKGYVLHASAPDGLTAERLCSESSLREKAAERGLSLGWSERAPHALWIDTGLTWFTKGLRQRLPKRLGPMVSDLAEAARSHGATLLPSAVRLNPQKRWEALVCGDEHFIEPCSEREKTVFCNLVRYYLPELIALTGRAGVSASGVEQLGSRRLAESRRHVPAREFLSLDPLYLPHLMKSLVRDARVAQTALLDIDPHAGEDPAGNSGREACVELRFVDAQATIRNSLAHAILFQALLIRARRLTVEGKAVPAYNQRQFERDRSRAIQHGLLSRFTPRRRASSVARSLGAERGNEERASFEPAPLRVLELIEDLAYEFRTLDVLGQELLPIVLGLKLRQWGHLSVQNENDLLQSELARKSSDDLEQRLLRLLANDQDRLTEFNQSFKPHKAVRKEWDARLWTRASDVDRVRGREGEAP
jgi:hypothetical protein